MKVTFSRRALAQLAEACDYIATDNPQAAASLIERVQRLAFLIGESPALGRPTSKQGVRVASVRRFPYLVFYREVPGREEIRILRIRHMSRRPQE